MYWSRGLLKQNAKQVLRESYWRVFLAWLLITLGVGAASSVLSYIIVFVPTIILSFVAATSPEAYIAGVIILYILMLVFILVFNALVTLPVNIGGIRYTMENRAGYPPLDTVLSPFRDKVQYLNVVKVMFFYTLEIMAFSFLFIIPGVVRGYQLRYVPYLLAENPYMSYKRAKELSKALTYGEKMEIFVLDLSFIGWYLLGYLTCSLGIYFLLPYVQATMAELYSAARAKAFAMGISGEEELSGFTVYPRR